MANLPYGIAAGVLLRTVAELPGVSSWVAMVQREVGERLAAAPGSGAYGTPSVLAQLECEVEVLRAIPRTVFFPVPNVDSVLVGMRRRPQPTEGTRAAMEGSRPTSGAARARQRRRSRTGASSSPARWASRAGRRGARGSRCARR